MILVVAIGLADRQARFRFRQRASEADFSLLIRTNVFGFVTIGGYCAEASKRIAGDILVDRRFVASPPLKVAA